METIELLVGGPGEKPLWKIWVSQLGWLFPIYGNIKNVPNHQPEFIDDLPSIGMMTFQPFIWMGKCQIDGCSIHHQPGFLSRLPRQRFTRSRLWARCTPGIPWKSSQRIVRSEQRSADLKGAKVCWRCGENQKVHGGYKPTNITGSKWVMKNLWTICSIQ